MNNWCTSFETYKVMHVERGKDWRDSVWPAVEHMVPDRAEISRKAEEDGKHETG